LKIKRLRIENFKRFRSPFELAGLSDGLNLFVAPNEAGKSTVAEAIRASFFERHRSTAVESLRPWGDSSATPTVEIEFSLSGKPARLLKAFLGKKRCELTVDGTALSGNVAEDHLGSLLGFRFAGKGANAPEHMGIPGLLWMRQGTSHEIADAVRFASEHLRNALGESLGDLAATSGDAVLKAVEAERKELLTASTNAPRGALSEAISRKEALEFELAELRSAIETYRSGVDRLATLRRDRDREEAIRPWQTLREQLERAQTQLAEAKGLADKKSALDIVLKQATVQVNAVRSQLQTMERDVEALGMREKNLLAAQDRLGRSQVEMQAWEPRHLAAAQVDSKAREGLRISRQAAARVTHAKAVADLSSQLGILELALSQAQLEDHKLTDLRSQAQALSLSATELTRLRHSADALRTAQARLDTVATALEFTLQPTALVQVAGQGVTGSTRLTVVARTDIHIAGVGQISVLPGGADLDRLASERDRHQDELAALLQALGVDSVATAEERLRLQALRAAEAKAAEAVLATLAPKGLAALAADVKSQTTRLAEARSLLETMSLPPDGVPALTVIQAEAEEAAARSALAETSAKLNETKVATANANAQVQAAEEELKAVQATVNDPLRAERKAEANRALTDALAHQASTEGAMTDLATQLQAANLSVLAQDVERIERSLRQSEATRNQRAVDITRLEADLEAKGALGQEETAAQKQRELELSQRRFAELDRRAKALDHLWKLLDEKRAALARRLRAPLQKHLNHYLQILFPGSSIEVEEDLSPGRITRVGLNGAESGEFEDLSVGTREQMGVVARLAYADLLQAAGKPTLLILDDALVHTDQDRLGQMKRVLYDAAARHQILIFSCHPHAWHDLGAAPRLLV
jgi:DNA repair exonuclease SbcCD ATPase subunit